MLCVISYSRTFYACKQFHYPESDTRCAVSHRRRGREGRREGPPGQGGGEKKIVAGGEDKKKEEYDVWDPGIRGYGGGELKQLFEFRN